MDSHPVVRRRPRTENKRHRRTDREPPRQSVARSPVILIAERPELFENFVVRHPSAHVWSATGGKSRRVFRGDPTDPETFIQLSEVDDPIVIVALSDSARGMEIVQAVRQRWPDAMFLLAGLPDVQTDL